MPETEHLTVDGRVQGVNFRASACRRARQLGLVGWVRNRPDGAVELAVQGDADALAEFRDWLRTGPPGARVDALKTLDEPATVDRDDFKIR